MSAWKRYQMSLEHSEDDDNFTMHDWYDFLMTLCIARVPVKSEPSVD